MSVIVMTDRIRSLRAVVFAALCVALAATAHVAMAGNGVSPPVLAGAFVLTLTLTWLLAGRRRGFWLIGAWMSAAQLALHLTFEQAGTLSAGGGLGRMARTDWAALLLCNPEATPSGLSPEDLARMAGLDPTVPPAVPPLAAAVHHAHGAAGGNGLPSAPHGSGSGMAGMAGMSGHGMAPHGLSTGMIAAHVLAALACALLLWRGETALTRLFELLGALGSVLAGALLAPLLALAVRPVGYRPPGAPRPVGHRARLPRLVLLSHALVRRGPPSPVLAR
ncbi:hypothetical protein [Kitasatospora sp. NPDC093806]|uniref:hypothetical protein n=1 Tax=Kitasatospora sp. NPDC093806 TaxID=3155075 RepID=UPI00343F61D4